MSKFKNPALAGTGSACFEKPEYAFWEAMQATLGPLDSLPVGDGTLHRIHIPGDKSGTLNGWYVLHLDGLPSGAFGSWKTGQTHTWSSRQPVSNTELRLLFDRIEQVKAQRKAEQQQRQHSAMEKAQYLWAKAMPPDPAHPYLSNKGVLAHNLRQSREALLVPLIDANGQLTNLQFIHPDGSKRFLTGGRLKGCCSPIGYFDPSQRFLVCEGWATGATLHQNTGNTTLCAMTASNLAPVAEALRAHYPKAEILICGDDDRFTLNNPGRKAARYAALAASAQYCLPVWPAGAPEDLTDFNDLACWLKENV